MCINDCVYRYSYVCVSCVYFMLLYCLCCGAFRCLASAVCCYTVPSQQLEFTDVYISTLLRPRCHMQFSCRSRVQARWQQLRVACHAPSRHIIKFLAVFIGIRYLQQCSYPEVHSWAVFSVLSYTSCWYFVRYFYFLSLHLYDFFPLIHSTIRFVRNGYDEKIC